ncbi:MAG: mechanosensitive ion channel family protein [Bacillota bacterium]
MAQFWTSLELKWAPILQVLPTLGRLLAILLLAKLATTVGVRLVSRAFASYRQRTGRNVNKIKTMEALSRSVLRYTIYFITAITLLSQLGIRTDSLLASAGIVGLAVSFGAQSLVKDVLTGMFIIFEDQFAVGEYIETAGLSGYVEEIGLRVTKLRDFSGVIHTLPNGEIGKVTNHSRDHRTALVEVGVAYDEDVLQVQNVLEQAMQQVGQEMAEKLADGPKVVGITDLGASGMVFRLWAKALPMEQWGVERAMRKAVSLAFQREGISLYYPHIVTVPYVQGKE